MSRVGADAGTAYAAASCAGTAWVFLLIATCSPWMILGSTFSASIYYTFGFGPFVAGASWGANGWYWVSSYVYWSDLNTKNVCDNNLMLNYYGIPNGMCIETSNNSGVYNFVLPSQIIGIQATICLATIFSFFSCVLGCSVSKSREGGGFAAAVSSLLAMIFSICAFAIWTTWGLSQTCLNPGCAVPSWTSTPGELTLVPGLSVQGPPSNVPMYYGGSFIITCMAFCFLVFSTAMLFAVSNSLKRGGADDGGAFGAGI